MGARHGSHDSAHLYARELHGGETVCKIVRSGFDSHLLLQKNKEKIMEEQKTIFAIICMTTLKEKSSGWPDFGHTSFMGYYTDKNDAIKTVLNNMCDIAECCYKYAVVEEIPMGVYPHSKNRWFFEYDHENDCFHKIEEPKFMGHFVNIL